jgi:hypothetical protein
MADCDLLELQYKDQVLLCPKPCVFWQIIYKPLREGRLGNSERSKFCSHWVLQLARKEGPSFANAFLTSNNSLKHRLIEYFVLYEDLFDFNSEKWDIFVFPKFWWYSLQMHYCEGWTQGGVMSMPGGLQKSDSPESTPPGAVAVDLVSGESGWTHAHAASVCGSGQCPNTTAGWLLRHCQIYWRTWVLQHKPGQRISDIFLIMNLDILHYHATEICYNTTRRQ